MKKCDLLMKGGITSGIVYPGAVCELANEYRFSSIGGTSAGAIAAALTAAAEYRRQSGSSAGFEEVSRLPAWLAATTDGRSRLLQLFTPSAETAPLFEVAIAYIETPGTRFAKLRALVSTLVSRFSRYGSIALALGALFLVIELFSMTNAGMVLVALATIVVTAAAFAIAAAIEALVTMARTLPGNGFALCSGLTLTEWLDTKISEVAGIDRPLTFGDLERKDVHLQMMTTNLTHGRPYRMPFETKQFFFDEAEMRSLFPERVVRWMIDHSTRRWDSLRAMPSAADLPVVVATRMSLSFPLLLSAVPLWAGDFGRRGGWYSPERCWFSDGGITSNFPVHFFDAPLPRWPTFAFNLAERTSRYHEEGQTTYVPRSNRGGILEWWTPFDSLYGFLQSIMKTMQNWRDNMLLHQPGQRDRIAHVLLAPHEGGLNLTMDPQTIGRVAARGKEAAAILRAHFGDTPPEGVTLTWSNHKWVRFLAFMPALERAMESCTRAFGDRTAPPSFDELLTSGALPSYKISATDRAAMRRASLAFVQHLHENFGAAPFRKPAKRPRPEPVLRAMPQE